MSNSGDEVFELLVQPGFEDVASGKLRVASGRVTSHAVVADGVARVGLGDEVARPAWGGADDPEYALVSGWVAVSDLDGAGGSVIPGVLCAAVWGGRLWLRYAESAPEAEADAPEAEAGAVYGGAGSVVDGVVRLPENGRSPALYVVPMGARDGFLKREGRWRVDVPWEVLAVYSVHPGGARWSRAEGDAGFGYADDWRVTIWLVPVGRALCFVTTSSSRWVDEAGSLAATAERMRFSEFGRGYGPGPAEGVSWSGYGGPHGAFWCALLPWEAEGSEPWRDEGAQDWCQGFEVDAMRCGGVVDGLSCGRREVYARPVSVCGRFHDSSWCGMGRLAMGWTVPPESLEEVLGEQVDSWLEALEVGLVHGPLGLIGQLESAQDYRFDPDSVEGLGLCAGYSGGCYVAGAELWPPVAARFRVTMRMRVVAAGGSAVNVVLAGTEADGVLLTASLHAEVFPGDGPDAPDGPGVPDGPVGPVGPDEPDVPDNPDPGDEEEPRPGPWWPEPEVPEDPDDPDVDGVEVLEDGFYYVQGNGLRVERSWVRSRPGWRHVVHVYDVPVSGFVTCDVKLSVSTRNAAQKYDYPEGDAYGLSMFYGVSASGAGFSVSWRSSYLGGDSLAKSATASVGVSCDFTATVEFYDFVVSSETPPAAFCGGVLQATLVRSFVKQGTYRSTSAAGVPVNVPYRRRFQVYRLSVQRGAIETWAQGVAESHAPVRPGRFSPGSVAGRSDGIDGPVVFAEVASVVPRGGSGSSVDMGGLSATVVAEYGEAMAQFAVSGSSQWNSASDSPRRGSISGSFTVSVPRDSVFLEV